MASKISIAGIIWDHCGTLRNNNTGRLSWGDIVLFILFPLVLGVSLYCYGVVLTDLLSSILATALSLFAGLLFNLLLLVYDLLSKEEASAKPNNVRQDLLDEVSKNISFCILISLLVIILLTLNSFKINAVWSSVISAVAFWLSTIFVLTLLMILKRIHNLLVTTFRRV